MDLVGRSLLRRWMPRRTVRLRLTLLYGGLFLLAGAVLLTITYELVSHSPAATAKGGNVFVSQAFDGGASAKLKLPPPPNGVIETVRAQGQTGRAQGQPAGGQRSVSGGPIALAAYAGNVNRAFKQLTAASAKRLHQVTARAEVAIHAQQSAQLGTLLTRSAIALGIMAIVSVGLGWLIAGRALRPVRTMSARARGISERNLHERLGLGGPNDELKELGDTFDELLGRLEAAFESQRQFVANASHELRTPLTLERALVEVALADPDATTDSLRAACERVLVASESQERLIEALLTLARSQRGLESRQQLDLAEVAAEELRRVLPSGTRVESDLESALTTGDPALLERLVGNLIDNALRYNLEQDGWVSVWTGMSDGRPTLRVGNSGPVVSRDEVAILTEPFRRLNGTRTETRGTGLGLSIVAAIASAHGAGLRTTPRPDGGLDVEVAFSAVTAPSDRGVPQRPAAYP
jgi:signal transduction histidine kinase